VKRRRRAGFFRHFSVYAIINAGIGAIDLLSGPGSFVLFGAVMWGIPLAVLELALLYGAYRFVDWRLDQPQG